MRSRMMRAAAGAAALTAALTLGGCGSSSGGALSVPKVAPARVFTLAGFQTPGPVRADQPVTVSFTVRLPARLASVIWRAREATTNVGAWPGPMWLNARARITGSLWAR